MAVDASYGYGGDGGSIDEQAWALAAPSYGSQPGIVTPLGEQDGLHLTITNAATRQVLLSAGKVAGWGIFDVISDTTLAFTEYTGGTYRWDAIVLHRDWQATPNGLSTLTVVAGAGGDPAPPAGLAAQPGVAADQVLWLVKVTNSGLTDTLQFTPSIGQTVYYPHADPNAILRPEDYRYGTLVVQYGTPPRLLLRRGGVGDAATFDDLLDPPWTNVSPFSTLANFSSARALGLRVRGGMLEVRGTLVSSGGGPFIVGGGVDGNYDICTVPAGMRPSGSRVSGPGSDSASLRLSYSSSTNRLTAEVFGSNTNFIFLDGTSFSM